MGPIMMDQKRINKINKGNRRVDMTKTIISIRQNKQLYFNEDK